MTLTTAYTQREPRQSYTIFHTQQKLHNKNYTTFPTQQKLHNFYYTTPANAAQIFDGSQPEQTPSAPTIREDYLQDWEKYLDAKPRTVEAYTKNLKAFYRYLREETPGEASQPTRETILKYRDHLKAKYKPATVQAYLEAVKLFFEWTDLAGLYPNIARHVKGPKLDRSFKKDYFTANQAGNILDGINRDTLQGLRDYAIVLLMVTTGARAVEITRANLEDLRTAGGDPVLYLQGKGHDEKADYVKLAPETETAIRAYLKERGTAPGNAPLFACISNRNQGGRMTTRSISRLAKGHMKEAGYDSDRLTAHSLRHTAATLNLLNGGTLEETQQLLRHTSINTTLIYSHALERAANNSENRISAAIFKKKKER